MAALRDLDDLRWIARIFRRNTHAPFARAILRRTAFRIRLQADAVENWGFLLRRSLHELEVARAASRTWIGAFRGRQRRKWAAARARARGQVASLF